MNRRALFSSLAATAAMPAPAFAMQPLATPESSDEGQPELTTRNAVLNLSLVSPVTLLEALGNRAGDQRHSSGGRW